MKILIATDIFGETPSHLALCERLALHHSVTSLSPYEHNPPAFANESDAYQYFLQSGGMDNYLLRLKSLENAGEIDIALGFSAGGAAVWAGQHLLPSLKKAIAFYPGQIRNYLEVQPAVPWHIVFAQYEAHFDQNQIIDALLPKTALSLYRAPYRHGFVNPDSQQFNYMAREQAIACLLQSIDAVEGDSFANYYEKFGNTRVTD